ncbi:unnamed protein product [Symbiodinium sp. CCMP2456]|nr:unnamed protein product [Symbiodinium sp. CCMP2456]
MIAATFAAASSQSVPSQALSPLRQRDLDVAFTSFRSAVLDPNQTLGCNGDQSVSQRPGGATGLLCTLRLKTSAGTAVLLKFSKSFPRHTELPADKIRSWRTGNGQIGVFSKASGRKPSKFTTESMSGPQTSEESAHSFCKAVGFLSTQLQITEMKDTTDVQQKLKAICTAQ